MGNFQMRCEYPVDHTQVPGEVCSVALFLAHPQTWAALLVHILQSLRAMPRREPQSGGAAHEYISYAVLHLPSVHGRWAQMFSGVTTRRECSSTQHLQERGGYVAWSQNNSPSPADLAQ